MGLDLSQLEKVKNQGSKVIARCPACAEASNDRKGEHLFIEPGGRFGCVVYPGSEGHIHRQRIFELVGIQSSNINGFNIRQPLFLASGEKVIQKDILGRWGHIKSTHARNDFNNQSQHNSVKESTKSVPAVPNENLHSYSTNELEMLKGIDEESLKKIDEVKHMFNGTVVGVTAQNP